jgi:hypothetical protein
LGYRPQFDLQEGVELTVSWYRQRGLLKDSGATVRAG